MSVLGSRKHRLAVADNPVVGVFISTDQGTTWQHRGWTNYIRTFYAVEGADGAFWSACGNGVLRSTDDGATWKITTGWEITEVLKVKVDPTLPATAYAASAYGVFRTTDACEHWAMLPIPLTLPFASDLLIDASNRNHILVATERGIFSSTNGGGVWTARGLAGKGIRTIVQVPHLHGTFWAGTEDDGVFFSSDGGSTWTPRNSGLHHKTVYAIAFAPGVPTTIYLGTHGGGVYTSTDGGRSWREHGNGLQDPDVHALVVLPSDPSIILAGTLNGGLYRSTDAGTTWQFNSQEEAQVWGLSVNQRR